jgi:hypothetical protein
LDRDLGFKETPRLFRSVQDLVFYYGDREDWWGDMGFHQTRVIYHRLLSSTGLDTPDEDLDTFAFLAYQTRQSIKSYVRRRSYLHVRWASMLFDSVRNLLVYKRWKRKTTFEELWDKYEQRVRKTNPHLDPLGVQEQTARTLIQGSFRTNPWVDAHFLS